MHELALCGSILRIADRARAGRPVAAVNVRVGRLRQVVPETLEHCWGLVVAGTPLAGSRLVFEQVPVTLRCRACGAVTTVGRDPVLACASCGSADTGVLTGEEFLVDSLDLAPGPDPRPHHDAAGVPTPKEAAHG